MGTKLNNKEPKKVIVDGEGKPIRKQSFESESFKNKNFSKIPTKPTDSSALGGTSRKVVKSYTQSEVREILESAHTAINQDKLVEISKVIYRTSNQYRRLISHFAGMPTYAYIITPTKDIRDTSPEKIKKAYEEIGVLAKKMKFKNELAKVHKIALIQDVFYGYVHEDTKSFYIQHIDYALCRISSVEDGVLNYSVNMAHFDGRVDDLAYYPDEFSRMYWQWKIDKATNSKIDNYVEVSPNNSICVKIGDETMEVMPPFAGVFDSIFDVEGFKKLRKSKGEMENYMTLIQKAPIRTDTDSNNDFAIDPDMMDYFHEQLADALPEEVGLATTPMSVEAVNFKQTKVGEDGVAQAERDMWSSAGVSSLLFNADGKSSQGLLNSIKTDEELVFSFLRQLERWINRRIRRKNKNGFFEISILDVTTFNKDEMYKTYLEAATYGFPTKTQLASTVGLEPIEMMSMMFLENDVLGMQDEMKPLQSSHTMSGDEATAEGGAPQKEQKDKADETVRTEDKVKSEGT